MRLTKWKGSDDVEEKHRHDYRWIKDKTEREEWMRKNWEVEDDLLVNDEVKG